MTLTVNGQPAEPGCYVDGHWGQYGGVHLYEQAVGMLTIGSPAYVELTEIRKAWPRNNDGSLCGAYGSDRDADEGKGIGPWAAIQNFGDTDGQIAMELSEEVLTLLNEHTEGGYWEWYDGECFLRSYVCSHCNRHAITPCDIPPCDYCCDADDPGCFA